MTNEPKTTDVDFHLAVEASPGGGAHILGDWSVRLPGTTFNVNIEVVTSHSVNEAIGYMSDLQRQMVDSIRTFGVVHGATFKSK